MAANAGIHVFATRREAKMDDRTHNPTLTGTGLTQSLAARAQVLRYEQLSPEARQLVRQCVSTTSR
jgi:hypothetical protein